MRRFGVSELGPGKFAQLSFVGLRALSQNDKGVRRFAPAFVRQANNRHFLHRRVPQENAFDLNGRNVFAAANDDVFQAVADSRQVPDEIDRPARLFLARTSLEAKGLGFVTDS